jgi:molybdate transport system ATP-binding protein
VNERGIHVDVEKRLAGVHLRARLDAAGEVLVLFGPSGAGKTSILNIVVGLLRPDAGVVAIEGRLVFNRGREGRSIDVPARLRNVGYVMQSYALFPHMTALENAAYPLRRAPDRFRRARDLLARLAMAEHADRRPAQLSGGQQQRVALARALAAGPRILLLDEPFAALDGAMRERLQDDLRALRDEFDLTMLLVTHRLEDAFALGHRLAVIDSGQVRQMGLVEDVFRRPANRSVAEIMGIRNLIRARIAHDGDGAAALDWDGMLLAMAPGAAPAAGTEVTAYIRPEDVKLVYPDRPLTSAVAHNIVDATISAAAQSASTRVLQVALPNGRELEVRFPLMSYAPLRLEPGAPVRLALRREALVLLRE